MLNDRIYSSAEPLPDLGKIVAAQEMKNLRREIDSLDERIVALLLRRLEMATRLGAIKAQFGLLVRDINRERSVLEKIRNLTGPCFAGKHVLNIYQAIMKESRATQNVRPVTDTEDLTIQN